MENVKGLGNVIWMLIKIQISLLSKFKYIRGSMSRKKWKKYVKH